MRRELSASSWRLTSDAGQARHELLPPRRGHGPTSCSRAAHCRRPRKKSSRMPGSRPALATWHMVILAGERTRTLAEKNRTAHGEATGSSALHWAAGHLQQGRCETELGCLRAATLATGRGLELKPNAAIDDEAVRRAPHVHCVAAVNGSLRQKQRVVASLTNVQQVLSIDEQLDAAQRNFRQHT
jgi:hypothetical protein